MAGREVAESGCTSFWKTLPGLIIGFIAMMAVIGFFAAVFFIQSRRSQIPLPTTSASHQPTERTSGVLSGREPSPIGRSVQGRRIESFRFGRGPRTIVIAAAIHGSEANTSVLVEDLVRRLDDRDGSWSQDLTLFLIPRLNPDGQVLGSRYNARGVDLNRNWDTNNWESDIRGPSGIVPDGGGDHPFSEPETAALSLWLHQLRDQGTERLAVIIYHSSSMPTGLIQPGYQVVNGRLTTDPEAARLALSLAEQLGYRYSPTWPDYPITGEAIHWCAENGISCMDVELPSQDNLSNAEVQVHLSALLRVIQGHVAFHDIGG